jgi:GNAT superfamily N-acetyltransferase
MDQPFTIRRLSAEEAQAAAPALGEVLFDCVEDGASVSFMADLTRAEATAFWLEEARAGDGRAILVAEDAEGIFGVVQLIPAGPPNQPHRADVSKMLVHRRGRRLGAARALLLAIEDEARAMGRWLLILDTVTGSPAEDLYRSVGWQAFGVVEHYALFPDGTFCAATFYSKRLTT